MFYLTILRRRKGIIQGSMKNLSPSLWYIYVTPTGSHLGVWADAERTLGERWAKPYEPSPGEAQAYNSGSVLLRVKIEGLGFTAGRNRGALF
jgi:hypothetical protein